MKKNENNFSCLYCYVRTTQWMPCSTELSWHKTRLIWDCDDVLWYRGVYKKFLESLVTEFNQSCSLMKSKWLKMNFKCLTQDKTVVNRRKEGVPCQVVLVTDLMFELWLLSNIIILLLSHMSVTFWKIAMIFRY